MSGISAITQAPGFDQQRYDNFIQQARAEKMDAGVVDHLLLGAIRNGKSFDQALDLMGSGLPKLEPPAGSSLPMLKDWPGLPSPGALIMSVTTEYAAAQRRQNQELMWQETEALAQSMKDQAKEMRQAAVTQLVLGCVSGAVNIVGGIAQVGIAGSSAKQALTDPTMMVKLQGVGQMTGGAAKMIESGGQYVGSQMQARLKEMDADQEKMRAVRDSIKNLDETLRELIRKSLSAQNDIQASTNQARTRILA